MKTDVLKLKLSGGRSYPIYIGPGTVKVAADASGLKKVESKALIVTDRNVAAAHLKTLEKVFAAAGVDYSALILPPGERQKNFGTYKKIVGNLAAMADKRDLTVVAFGGGVVGDMAGFAAATYRRGISLVQIPTTLLANVDSSVGGKTGIDLPEGKNLVGSFYQPKAVIIDTDFLSTLPMRELRCGMAEVIKYGFIMDAKFASHLDKSIERLLGLDKGELTKAIYRCCELKAKVVSVDERDEKGVRAILNFGHTFAHAIETACGYAKYRHGEAVGIGMACAADLSAKLGFLDGGAARRIEDLIIRSGLPTSIEGAKADELMNIMLKDKKTRAGKMRFILLDRIGHAFISDLPKAADVRGVLKKRIR